MKKSQKIVLVIGIAIIGLILWILFLPQKPEISEPSGIVSYEEVVVPAGNTYADPKFINPVEYLPFKELPAAVAEQFTMISISRDMNLRTMFPGR